MHTPDSGDRSEWVEAARLAPVASRPPDVATRLEASSNIPWVVPFSPTRRSAVHITRTLRRRCLDRMSDCLRSRMRLCDDRACQAQASSRAPTPPSATESRPATSTTNITPNVIALCENAEVPETEKCMHAEHKHIARLHTSHRSVAIWWLFWVGTCFGGLVGMKVLDPLSATTGGCRMSRLLTGALCELGLEAWGLLGGYFPSKGGVGLCGLGFG